MPDTPSPQPHAPLQPHEPTWKMRLHAAWLRLRHGEHAWGRAVGNHLEQEMEALWATRTSATHVDDHFLFRSLEFKNPRFMAALLDCGVDPNQQHLNNYWDYPIHRAVARGLHEKLALLIRAGANLQVHDGNGYSPLATALHGFSEKIAPWKARRPAVFALLDAGARADGWIWRNRQSLLDITPLDEEVIEHLIQAGADPAALKNPTPGSDFPPLDGPRHLLFRADELPNAAALATWLGFMAKYDQGPATLEQGGEGLVAHMVRRWPQDRSLDWEDQCRKVLDVLAAHGHDLHATDEAGNTVFHAWARSNSICLGPWGQALLAHPTLAALATEPNHAGATPMDVLNARTDLPSEKPWLAPVLARMGAAALDQVLPVAAPAHPTPRLRL